jgi:hypothetical protein
MNQKKSIEFDYLTINECPNGITFLGKKPMWFDSTLGPVTGKTSHSFLVVICLCSLTLKAAAIIGCNMFVQIGLKAPIRVGCGGSIVALEASGKGSTPFTLTNLCII